MELDNPFIRAFIKKIDLLTVESLVSEKPKTELVENLELYPDENGKYLTSFIQTFSEKMEVDFEEARNIIGGDENLCKLMFILA